MAYPVIKFNTSTGNDSLSSGAGPDDPVNGSGASLNATTTVDLSADNPDLSTIATDGSAVLWVETTSGRKFSQITGVDDSLKTVTVNTAYSVTESTKNWAIGGKRSEIDDTGSRRVFQDAQALWTIEIETDQTITSSIPVTSTVSYTDGRVMVRGSDPDNRPIITAGGDYNHFQGTSNSSANYAFSHLQFQNTDATVSASQVALTYRDGGEWLVYNCVFGDETNRLYGAVSVSTGGSAVFTCIDCEFKYLERGPYATTSTNDGRYAKYINCYSHHNGSMGFELVGKAICVNCISHSNDGHGIYLQGGAEDRVGCVTNCIIDNNGQSAIYIENNQSLYVIFGNIMSNNGEYGIRSSETLEYNELCSYVSYNAFYNNASGNVNDTTSVQGVPSITLTENPYIDTGNTNYNINSTIGGGATFRSQNQYQNIENSNTKMYPFRQWITTDFGRGGGGTILPSYAKLTIKGN